MRAPGCRLWGRPCSGWSGEPCPLCSASLEGGFRLPLVPDSTQRPACGHAGGAVELAVMRDGGRLHDAALRAVGEALQWSGFRPCVGLGRTGLGG